MLLAETMLTINWSVQEKMLFQFKRLHMYILEIITDAMELARPIAIAVKSQILRVKGN